MIKARSLSFGLATSSLCASLLLSLALVGCDEKKPEATPAPAASTAAAAKPSAEPAAAKPSAEPAASASAAASAPAPADSAAAPAGDLTTKLESAKAEKGKVDSPDRKLKSNLGAFDRKCLSPALKKDPASVEGSLKLAIALDAEGKVKKITHTADGKVPDELAKCIEQHIEKKIEFDTEGTTPTLNVVLKFAPKGDAGKAEPAKK